MKKNWVVLLSKEDAKDLCQGLILDRRVTCEMMSNKNILDAAEVLLAIGDTSGLVSKAELLSRALDHGWTPSNTTPTDMILEKKATDNLSQIGEKSKEEIKSNNLKNIMKKSNLLDIVEITLAFVLLFYSGASMLILVGRGFGYIADREAFKKETLSPIAEYIVTIGAASFCIGSAVIMTTKE